MKKTVLTFGLISGTIMSLLVIVTIPFQEAIGFENGMWFGYAGMVAAFLLIFFGIKTYRDNVNGGSVTFGRAFKVGAGIAIISALMYVTTWEIIYFGFDSDFMEKYQAYTMEQARARGASAAELALKEAENKVNYARYQNPLYNSAVTLLEALPLGIIVSLISSGILSRKQGGYHTGLSEAST